MFHRKPRPDDLRLSRLAEEIQQRRSTVRWEIDKALDSDPADDSTGLLFRVFTSVSVDPKANPTR
jgi:hypothetical protein